MRPDKERGHLLAADKSRNPKAKQKKVVRRTSMRKSSIHKLNEVRHGERQHVDVWEVDELSERKKYTSTVRSASASLTR